MNLIFDHIGILVNDIESAKSEYKNITGSSPGKNIRVESQCVEICFVGEIELIKPDLNTKLDKLLSLGINFYHVAYKALNFDETIVELKKKSYSVVGSAFSSEAFDGKRCQFLKNTSGHLIEIIEN